MYQKLMLYKNMLLYFIRYVYRNYVMHKRKYETKKIRGTFCDTKIRSKYNHCHDVFRWILDPCQW